MSETEEAFSRFALPYWRRLNLVARRYAKSQEDAQDLVQETLMRAWANYSPSDERTYRAGWLFVILRRIAAEWARTAGRRIKLVPVDHDELTELLPRELSDPFARMPSVTEDAFCELLDDKIVAALDSLETVYREVILLSVAGDLTYREVAQVLDCPVGTVMSRMARARCTLRERLSEFAQVQGWIQEIPR